MNNAMGLRVGVCESTGDRLEIKTRVGGMGDGWGWYCYCESVELVNDRVRV